MGLISNFVTRLTESNRQYINQFFGSFTANGMAVDDNSLLKEGYATAVDLYAIISKIKDLSATIPWMVEQRQSGGEWIEIYDTPVHELMDAPNKEKGYSWNDINEMLDVYTLVNGNGYLYGNSGITPGLGVASLDVLPSNLTEITANKNWLMPDYKYSFELDDHTYRFDKEEIGHVKFFNPIYDSVQKSLYGLSPVAVAAQVVTSSNERWEADNALMKNRGIIGMITDRSNRPMTRKQADQQQESFDERTAGAQKFGKTFVTNKDLSYVQLAMSSTDLQILEKGIVNLRSLCNVFGTSSQLFNDPANSTYNNVKEAEKRMFTNSIMPNMDRKCEVYNQLIVRSYYPDGNVRLKPNYKGVESLQEDFHEKAKTYALLKNSGIITANQAAENLELEQSDDENADKLLISNSTTLLETLDDDKTTDAKGTKSLEENEGKEDGQNNTEG